MGADGRLHAGDGRRLGRRQAVRAPGTDPDRTRGPVGAPPAHRPHRPEGRARDAAQPRQPCHLGWPDGSGPQPERRPRLHATGPARGDDGLAAQEHRHRRGAHRRHAHVHRRARLRHRTPHRQRRHHRRGHRLRLAGAGQGLPVRHLHDLRGPVRRRRRGRPRRGLGDRRGREPPRHPAARRQRHRLVRAQRRDPPRRQHEPELGAHGAGRDGRLHRGPGHRASRAAGGRARPVGGRGLQGPRHRGARGVGRGVSRRRRHRHACDAQDRAPRAVGRGASDARAGQGALPARGHRPRGRTAGDVASRARPSSAASADPSEEAVHPGPAGPWGPRGTIGP